MTKPIGIPDASDKTEREYQICTKTIMDTSDPDIQFDEGGVCNHYHNYFEVEKKYVLTGEAGAERLQQVMNGIKDHRKGRRYDSILGLSGGVDSTYLCLLAKEHGLNPLVVHFDNGWNSELAVHNIEQTVNRLGFDLYTYVVDWSEFRDLQRSYFAANVVDIEVLTDHGFMAVLHEQAKKHKIKYVLGGMNVVTEAILPSNWHFSKRDLGNIQKIQKTFGSIPVKGLTSYPMLSPFRRRRLKWFLGIEVVSPLNLVDFKYANVKSRITKELGWRDYGGKHYESIFTRFYQGYILPQKFRFDKRRAHLSTLICSGQMNREDALRIISEPGYSSKQFELDYPFVLKKLGFSESDFESYMTAPRVEQNKYSSKSWLEKYPFLVPIKQLIRKFS